ncbi:FAD-dependent oxidoreductase [Candidatus Gottesmanbacteria bacterium]|nr:FAD-dependent oxidoreductase [Candidatus Gottesmanbacteria bacterium]
MKIAIVGGGFTGLTAAYELAKRGHAVTIFEKDNVLGGLAHGFTQPGWDWHLEAAYHHLFANDSSILGLIDELGLGERIIAKRPITATQWNGHTYQFDSPRHLFAFPGLPMIEKCRTGIIALFCKLFPFWQLLEGVSAESFFTTVGGTRAWKTIWEPLMYGKFGQLYHRVPASWLWARIKKRTPKLYYIEGGFHTLVSALEKAIKHHGGTIVTGVPLQSISTKKNCIYVYGRSAIYNSLSRVPFDCLLLTVPTPLATKLIPHFSLLTSHFSLPLSIPHLHAQTLILETKEPILPDVYWLNITDRTFPFLAVVSHTNFINKKHYGGHHITYFGNYLPDGHRYLSMTAKQLLKEFTPYIKRLNPRFGSRLFTFHFSLFTGLYAQPVHELHYSRRAPKLTTPIPGLYIANLDSIYPWDRGTNYAVDLGKRAAREINISR